MNELESLEKKINDTNNSLEIRLSGFIHLKPEVSEKLFIGHQFVKGYIAITREGITIDGSNAHILVEIENCTNSDYAFFMFCLRLVMCDL